MQRKHYIDNLRLLCILLLIPYHAAMAYNTWGEGNYILLGQSRALSSLIVFVSPWYMTLLFLLAGVGARYSLAKRSVGGFVKERATKLLLPLLAGTVTVVPILCYIADKTKVLSRVMRKLVCRVIECNCNYLANIARLCLS